MSKWLRVDANCNRHPKMKQAGAWGIVVIKAAWEIAKDHDLKDGRLSVDMWSADFIGEHTRFDRETEWPDFYICAIAEGMESAEMAGLITRIEDDNGVGYIIHDWHEYQRSESYERVKRHREKDKCNVTSVTDRFNGVTETLCNESNANRTEHNRTEHNRTKKRKRSLVSLSPAYTSRADRLRESILAYKSDHRVASEEAYSKVLTKWSEDIRKLHEKDGISMDRIDAVLRWLPSDPFWPPNIQSGAALRKHWDRLEDECRKCSRPGEQTDEERKEGVRKCREMGMIIFSADDEPDPDPEEITND